MRHPGESVGVTLYLATVADASGWTSRKLVHAWGDGPSLVAGTTTAATGTVTTLSYTITDGGPWDADGAVDGVIIDPLGPGVAEVPPDGGPGDGGTTGGGGGGAGAGGGGTDGGPAARGGPGLAVTGGTVLGWGFVSVAVALIVAGGLLVRRPGSRGSRG